MASADAASCAVAPELPLGALRIGHLRSRNPRRMTMRL
jgi:hypothetical protein